MNCYLQKYTTYQFIYITYYLFQDIQKSKNDENPTSTSKVTSKTIIIILFELFYICNSFELKVIHEE